MDLIHTVSGKYVKLLLRCANKEKPYLSAHITLPKWKCCAMQLVSCSMVNSSKVVPSLISCILKVLFAHRLINPTAEKMFIGAIGLLPTTILVSVLTVALSSPIATRMMRILFLTWIAVVLFSTSPIFIIPTSVLNILGIVRIPLWPISACYQVSVSGTISLTGVLGMLLVAVYIIGLALVAGKWLERRELLLY